MKVGKFFGLSTKQVKGIIILIVIYQIVITILRLIISKVV